MSTKTRDELITDLIAAVDAVLKDCDEYYEMENPSFSLWVVDYWVPGLLGGRVAEDVGAVGLNSCYL